MEVILQWCTGQKQAILAIKLTEALRDLTVLILQLVGLIDDDVLPLELEELIHAGSHYLERGQTHIELAWLQLVLENVFSLSLSSDQVEAANLWAQANL